MMEPTNTSESVSVEQAKPAQPNREDLRRGARKLRHMNSKAARKFNDIKMKQEARTRAKLSRKPSNFTKGAE